MKYANIQNEDFEIYESLKKEEIRQKEGLELIPSENYTSAAVMESMGSILTNKYSEGYAKKRYYGGQEFIDQIEILAIERAKKLLMLLTNWKNAYSIYAMKRHHLDFNVWKKAALKNLSGVRPMPE